MYMFSFVLLFFFKTVNQRRKDIDDNYIYIYLYILQYKDKDVLDMCSLVGDDEKVNL